MCRHCERLVEDAEHKEVVHAFMAVLAEKINRLERERGIQRAQPLTADDVEFRAEVPNPRYRGPISGPGGMSEAVSQLLYRDLIDMAK